MNSFQRLIAGILVSASLLLVTSATATSSGNIGAVVHNGATYPILETFENGWVVTTPCQTEVYLDEGTPLDRVDVLLDPGHGGPETGSVGANGIVERDLNLGVAHLTRIALEELGYTVAMTRGSDLHMGIRQRAVIANALQPLAFVSIHHNGGAVRRSSDPGTESFHRYEDDDSRRLAGLLYEEVHAALDVYDLRWVDTVHQGASARIRSDRTDVYGILRLTPGINAAIVEAAYLSNPPEAELLAEVEVLQAEAVAIATAIHRFISTDDPGVGFNPAFVDPQTTGTGTGRNCNDTGYGSPAVITAGYSPEEFAAVQEMASRRGHTPLYLQRFGVYALDFFHALGGRKPIDPLPADAIPAVEGLTLTKPLAETWTPSDRIVIERVANAYGVTPAEAQKIGALLMVFLIGISS